MTSAKLAGAASGKVVGPYQSRLRTLGPPDESLLIPAKRLLKSDNYPYSALSFATASPSHDPGEVPNCSLNWPENWV